MGKLSKVFVTGGTGFIGTQLVIELVQRGHTVHVLRRPTSDTEGFKDERIHLFIGDLMNRESIRNAIGGCTQVYHLAAYSKNWAKYSKTFYQNNVEGLCNVCEIANEFGVERAVFASSIVTCGPTNSGELGDEVKSCSIPNCSTEYQASKIMGEQKACEYRDRGLSLITVNPTRVYGPGKLTEGNSVTRMIDLYDQGKFPFLLNHGMNIGNYAFVTDVVQGLILAMENGKPGERYILGGENISLKQLFKQIEALSGKKHFQINVPPWFALFYSLWQKEQARWFGLYPLITPGWVKTFLQDWAYSSAKAETQLGYKITPLKEGLRITLAWLHQLRKKSK
jgi:nucleoside-diphosphate-sugar epimerase